LKDPSVSVSRVAWGGDGNFIGKYASIKIGSTSTKKIVKLQLILEIKIINYY